MKSVIPIKYWVGSIHQKKLPELMTENLLEDSVNSQNSISRKEGSCTSIYDSSYIGTDTNLITFNGTNFPIYRVVSRMPQRRQIRELDIPIPFENGIADFETLIGQAAYIIEGVMYPGTESDYDTGLRALRKLASLDVSQADALSDDGYVPYVITEYGGNTKQIFMKVLYVDLPENTRKGLVQPFRLVCKIKDPIIYGGDLKTASTEQAEFTTALGTGIYPFTYSVIFGASTSSVTADALNDGDVPVYPVGINIYGPVSNPRITNEATGEYIQVDTNLATSSNNLSIAYDKDTLSILTDGVSSFSSLSSGSTLFKLQPGSNPITLTGSSISTGAYAILTFYNAYGL